MRHYADFGCVVHGSVPTNARAATENKDGLKASIVAVNAAVGLRAGETRCHISTAIAC